MSRRLRGQVAFDVADLDALANLLNVPVIAFFDEPVPMLSMADQGPRSGNRSFPATQTSLRAAA